MKIANSRLHTTIAAIILLAKPVGISFGIKIETMFDEVPAFPASSNALNVM